MNKKYALLIGINYTGTPNTLAGCINDTNHIREELIRRGYPPENITVLTDECSIKPTRQNILNELMKLISGIGEELFFHYSGHGSQVPDDPRDGDEADCLDECICPIDFGVSGMITDDAIRGVLCCMRAEQSLKMLLDCCRSGTGADLKYNVFGQLTNISNLILSPDPKQRPTPGKVMMISGCQDAQSSADAFINNTPQGAASHAFLKSVSTPTVKTYADLIKSMRGILSSTGYPQVPCISFGRDISLNEKFIL